MLSSVDANGKVRLNILQESPLDGSAWHEGEANQGVEKLQHWVPSRYNVRATAEDGRLVLWNTLSSSMSVFTPEQVPHVLALLKGKGFESRKEGLAAYLIDRGFLMRKGTNEYRQFLLRFGKQHYRTDRLELILMSSEDCNFRCKYCYEDFARGTMLPSVRQGIKKWLEKRLDGVLSMGVSWFGGEPLYGWEAVEDLGPFLVELTSRKNVAYSSHMTTNGYLLSPDTVDKLLAWKINDFQITLDGAPEDHDCNRPARDGSSTFWTIFENLKSMAQRSDDFYVGMRVNFDKSNASRLEQFIELAAKEFGDDKRFGINFHPVSELGSANDSKLPVCSQDEHDQILTTMRAVAFDRGLRIGTLRDANRIGSDVCYAARPYNLLIGASGKIMKCTVALDKADHNVVGQISEDGEMTIDHERLALWTEPAFESDSQCQKCVVLPSCQGISCPLPRIQDNERPCVPNRTGAKAALVDVLKYSRRQPRARKVLMQEQAPETK